MKKNTTLIRCLFVVGLGAASFLFPTFNSSGSQDLISAKVRAPIMDTPREVLSGASNVPIARIEIDTRLFSNSLVLPGIPMYFSLSNMSSPFFKLNVYKGDECLTESNIVTLSGEGLFSTNYFLFDRSLLAGGGLIEFFDVYADIGKGMTGFFSVNLSNCAPIFKAFRSDNSDEIQISCQESVGFPIGIFSRESLRVEIDESEYSNLGFLTNGIIYADYYPQKRFVAVPFVFNAWRGQVARAGKIVLAISYTNSLGSMADVTNILSIILDTRLSRYESGRIIGTGKVTQVERGEGWSSGMIELDVNDSRYPWFNNTGTKTPACLVFELPSQAEDGDSFAMEIFPENFSGFVGVVSGNEAEIIYSNAKLPSFVIKKDITIKKYSLDMLRREISISIESHLLEKVDLEISSDLIHWVKVIGSPDPATGVFTIPFEIQEPARFFRLKRK